MHLYTRQECRANRNVFLIKQVLWSICFPLGDAATILISMTAEKQAWNCSKNSLFIYNMVVLTAQQIVAYFYLSLGPLLDGKGHSNKTLQLADGAFHYIATDVEWSQQGSIMLSLCDMSSLHFSIRILCNDDQKGSVRESLKGQFTKKIYAPSCHSKPVWLLLVFSVVFKATFLLLKE